MYIIRSSLTEDVRQKAVERITSGIESRGGKIEKLHDWGRRRMAYEMQGNRDGHYYVIYFAVNPEAIPELKGEYRLHEDLLRSMITVPSRVMEEIKFKPLSEGQE